MAVKESTSESYESSFRLHILNPASFKNSRPMSTFWQKPFTTGARNSIHISFLSSHENAVFNRTLRFLLGKAFFLLMRIWHKERRRRTGFCHFCNIRSAVQTCGETSHVFSI